MPGREQSAGRDQLGHVRVVGQPAVAQPFGQHQRFGGDGRLASWCDRPGPQPGQLGHLGPGVVASLPEAPLGGRRPLSCGRQLTSGQRRLRPDQLRFGKILVEPLPPGPGHRGVQLTGCVSGEPGCEQRSSLVGRQHQEKAGSAHPVRVGGHVEQLQRGRDVPGPQVAVTQVVQRLGRDQVVAPLRRDAAAPDQIGARLPDLAKTEIGEAAIQQCTSEARGLRWVSLQHRDRIVEHLKRIAFPAGPDEDQASLEKQDAPVVGRGQAFGVIQEAERVLGAAQLGFPLRQGPEEPGRQAMVHLVHLPRVRLPPVFRPAQLPQSGAGVAGAHRRAACVALPQGALARLAGPGLGADERTAGAG